MTTATLTIQSDIPTQSSITTHKVREFSSADKTTTLELLKQYRKAPSAYLRDRIVRLNIGLVKKEVHFWADRHSELYDDLLQVGALGLIGAVDRFELNRGYAFSSFAVRYIRGEIQHYLRDKNSSVRIPRRWMDLQQQSVRVMQKLRNTLQREPSAKEVANALGVTLSEWQEAKLACQNRAPLSLDAPIRSEEDDSSSIGDLVADPRSNMQLQQEEKFRLQQALSLLEQRTREIVEFVFIEDLPQREVAKMLGVSAVTISRQLKKGLSTLRCALEAEAC
ncbi:MULTISPECIES: sigma-70 family RNA polymerase sigma factor [Pseudanabaena]|jgi:RNA polymerase sigma-B factor|uniref:sigma-70 family RNA polymerase sigma factor n=1 Tax=Pseudanabaena TaxID=1152 RepID=UPI00247839E8|nr:MULTISPECIES: sigma-70 family RNA polymerase sigma factor [Pseudanabaena]MEA5485789.1 sigma-70 family RNA polymerase sigma factor [Pseudanabaena sp. CCNP1317]WGS72320.1 sigma-70 family RNA polymerase sigma factor [Pseudanabaena galeata CCNP1313]